MGWLDEPDIIVAIIALRSISDYWNHHCLFLQREENEVRLKHLENELATKRRTQDARRDYEYEAQETLPSANLFSFNLASYLKVHLDEYMH